jgi:two-component system phosphate regulon sensor histidine kinase PhoR
MSFKFLKVLTTQLLFLLLVAWLFWLITNSLLIAIVTVFAFYFLWTVIVLTSIRESIEKDVKITWLGTRGFYSELYSDIQSLTKNSWKYRKKFVVLFNEVNALAGSLPDAALIVDDRYLIQWCNKASNDLLGINAQSDVGQRVDQLVRFPAFIAFLSNPDNGYVDIEDQANNRHLRFRVANYAKDKALITVRNVTQQVKTAQVRQDFIANASHELKTPLTTIKGYSELISDAEFETKEASQIATVITAQADRMNKIIEDLLELSKIESRNITLSNEIVNIEGLFAQLIEGFAYITERPETIIESAHKSQLIADKQLMYSIIENLLSNAYHYTPQTGQVILRSSDHAEGMMIEVIDTGMGMPSNEVTRITERFYRIDKGRSISTGGTGLGLSIVKHSLELLGGYLEIESEVNKGSTFRCVFKSVVR